MGEKTASVTERQRVDKWLFFTRMLKSRTLAQAAVEGGQVSVNGEKVRQSSQMLKPGDRVELMLERRLMVLEVVSGGQRRGPFEEARTLYIDHSPPPPKREDFTPFEQAIRNEGAGRPVKKERRELDRLMRGKDWSAADE